MATATRTKKTSEDIEKEIVATKAKLAALERRAYGGQLAELIKDTAIVQDFAAIRAQATTMSALEILAAIGEAVGIKRLEVKQGDVVKRKPVDPNKPKKPRAPKTKTV
jgi:hypothetical protein